MVVCDAHVLHAHHLPPTLQTAEALGTVPTATLQDALEAFEKDALLDALKAARGNRAKAARLLSTTTDLQLSRQEVPHQLEAIQGLIRAFNIEAAMKWTCPDDVVLPPHTDPKVES